MSHPDPSHDSKNVHRRDSDEKGFKFKNKAKNKALDTAKYTIKAKVKIPKFKLGSSKEYNQLQSLLEKRKK